MTTQHNLVYIGWNRWDSIWQRSHHLAKNLSHIFRVLYVDPVAYSIFGYVNNHLRGNHSRNLRPLLHSITDNLTVFTPPPLLPFSLDNELINRLDHILLARMIRQILQQLDMSQPVLWVTFPAHFPLLGLLGEALICYDCMDNYAAFYPPRTARARLTARLEKQLLSRSDLVITTALSLQHRLAASHAHVYLFRNAVGAQFLTYQPNSQDQPPDWPSGNGPVIGYMGTLARWLDFDTIAQIATRHPDWRLIFVGPAEIDLTPYRALANLHFLGQKPYNKLADYVARFDVGLIPFLMNELTLNVNPVKIYEYFALGKPVVATRLPELLPLAEACYLADSPAEFIQQVELAVENLHSASGELVLARQRRLIAQANTWDKRATEIARVLEAHLTIKQTA